MSDFNDYERMDKAITLLERIAKAFERIAWALEKKNEWPPNLNLRRMTMSAYFQRNRNQMEGLF